LISQTTSSMSPSPPFFSNVDRLHLQDTVAHLLHAHYRRFIATTSHSVPADRIGIRTRGVGHSPLSLYIDRQVLMFHNKACTKVTPPIYRLPPAQYSDTSRTVPGDGRRLRFRQHLRFFDTSSAVRFRSSPQSIPRHAIHAPLNPLAHHHGLAAAAAVGGLKPPSERRLRGTYPHLCYSIA